jgi:hypothetical protein
MGRVLERSIPVGFAIFWIAALVSFIGQGLKVTSYKLRGGMEGTDHSANAGRDSWRCLARVYSSRKRPLHEENKWFV